jgi:hypothetical protein
MKIRLIVGLSVVMNVALATVVLLSGKKAPPQPRPSRLPVTNSISVSVPPSPELVEGPSSAGVPFHWNEIVSEDLKIYRDNLRAIGCPESTVREIIRAVVNANFGARRQEILASSPDRYWNMALRGQLIQRQVMPQMDWARNLTALGEERKQLLADVLGRDALAEEDGQQTRLAEPEQQHSWLPPEKRGRLMELEEKYRQRLARWGEALKSRADGTPTAEDEARLQEWRNEFDDAEKQVLTPGELTELKLRESDIANWAASLPGFNPTEDEWRRLTELRSQLEKSRNELAARSGLTDEERTTRQRELQTHFDDSVQAALAEDRFARYQLANNSQYQALQNTTQRYGLPDNLAVQSLEAQQAAQLQAEQVRADSNLTPGQTQAALDALQQETERTLSRILGAPALVTYREYGGDWLEGLNR